MASPNILHNAYTDAPQQHPNLILGSLQLLFWLFFRPAAWRNHLKHIDPSLDLDSDTSLIAFIRQGRWRNLALWRLLIQGHLILPLIVNLTLGLVLLVLGESVENILLLIVWDVISALVLGVACSLIVVVALNVAFGLLFSLAFGLALSGAALWGVALWGLVFGEVKVLLAIMLGAAFGMAFSVALSQVALWSVFLSALVLSSFLVNGHFSIGLSVGVATNVWRPLLVYPFQSGWNFFLYQLDKRRKITKATLLRYHSSFWDELQFLRLYGLNKHLLLVMKHNPLEGNAAIDYLSSTSQHWVNQDVQIELNAQSLESCADVKAIRQTHQSLIIIEQENPVRNLLNIFRRISEDVDAALNQTSSYNQRLALRSVTDRLDANLQEFTRSSDKYTIRFRPIAKSWREIIANYAEELAKATELRQEIDSPYILGVPLTQEQEIFAGRNDIGTRIEQLLLDRRRPPLLLYGQRRMGKTSLLNNLGKLLPNSIIPMFVDLQGAPASASDHAGFLYNLARGMLNSAKKQGITLPPLTREALTSDPFTSFDEWLDTVEQVLEQNTALLMLDEFEVLDSAITKGRFQEQDVLGMLRHLIQHRPRFKVLLAGSHTIAEYQRWASYLINVQVVHISYLKEAEARQLIERPVKDFTLRYEPDAVERVLQLTRCHPFLIQLLCAEIIALKNEQDPSVRRLATLADVEAAIVEAFKSGGFFFADIENNQVDDNGRAILRFIAAQGEGAIALHQTLSQQFPHADITRKLLLQRELIEEVDKGDRFQVELIRRWFTLDR
jgi:hypothetical protein